MMTEVQREISEFEKEMVSFPLSRQETECVCVKGEVVFVLK